MTTTNSRPRPSTVEQAEDQAISARTSLRLFQVIRSFELPILMALLVPPGSSTSSASLRISTSIVKSRQPMIFPRYYHLETNNPFPTPYSQSLIPNNAIAAPAVGPKNAADYSPCFIPSLRRPDARVLCTVRQRWISRGAYPSSHLPELTLVGDSPVYPSLRLLHRTVTSAHH